MTYRHIYQNLWDWESLEQYDNEEIIGVCLTQRQIMILKGALVPAYWQTRWMGFPGGESATNYLDAMISMIDSQLDGNDCPVCNMEFRDNPQDLCEVQYSNDGGDTWVTMFRKDVCAPVGAVTPLDITNIYNDIENITTNNTTWDNDIINVAPQWEYVDEDSDKALCWAISFFVDMICDVSIEEIKNGNIDRRDENQWLEDVSVALSAGVIATLVLLPTAPVTLPAAVITFIAWASITSVEAIWDHLVGEDYSDFEDEDARQVIKCQMYRNIAGGTPQWTDWETSMDMHSNFCPPESTIARVVMDWCHNEDVYINYMILLEDINSIADTLPECPCPERWEHFWDFENVGPGTWTIYGDYGHYEEGIGFVTDLRLDGSWYSNMIDELTLGEEIPGFVQRCDGFQIHTTVVRGTWDGQANWLRMIQDPHAEFTQTQGNCYTGNPGWRHNFAVGTVDKLAIEMLRSCLTEDLEGYGSIILTGITLHGEGVDPFSGCDH